MSPLVGAPTGSCRYRLRQCCTTGSRYLVPFSDTHIGSFLPIRVNHYEASFTICGVRLCITDPKV